MYWRGHVGIALLAYAPVAAAVRVAGEPELAVLGAAVAVAFATVPDLDHRLPVAHRGPTHTVVFAVAAGSLVAFAAALVPAASTGTALAGTVGAVLSAGGGTALSAGGETALSASGWTTLPAWTPSFVGGVAALSVCSHVAGDAITPMGIRPFRPLSAWHVTFDLTPAANPRANRLFLGLGVAALALSVAITP